MTQAHLLTASYQQVLSGLDRRLAQGFLRLWMAGTTPQAKRAILLENLPPLVTALDSAGAAAAANHYQLMRADAAISSAFTSTPSQSLHHDQVTAMIRNATRGWLDGRADSKVLSDLSGGARRLARQSARETILQSTQADPARPRWLRQASINACHFCLMLVSRGAVYASDTAHFEAHDHCACTAIPIFLDTQIPPETAAMQDLWQQVVDTSSGDEATRMWRDYWTSHRRMNTDFRTQWDLASPFEKQAVHSWQQMDNRFYTQVQRHLRGLVGGSRDITATVDGLEQLLERGSTKSSLTAYRGVRSALNTFGTPADQLHELIGHEITMSGYLATSLNLQVPLREFIHPTGKGGAALIELVVPSGQPALWVPPLGSPTMAYQQELLFSNRSRILVSEVTSGHGIRKLLGHLI